MNLQWVDAGNGRHVLRDVDVPRRVRADVDLPNIGRLGARRHTRQHIVAYGLHRKGCDKANPAPHYDKKGRACFESDREIREFCARSQDTAHKWNFNAETDFADG